LGKLKTFVPSWDLIRKAYLRFARLRSWNRSTSLISNSNQIELGRPSAALCYLYGGKGNHISEMYKILYINF